jgi:hypothetical protein
MRYWSHTPNEQSVLKEVWRVLKDGGIFALFAPNRLYPFETHVVNIKKLKVSIPIWVPFVSYIPLAIGTKVFTYSARNYFPLQLRRIVEKVGFKINHHEFLQQTFENISQKMPVWYNTVTPFLRFVFKAIGNSPISPIISVSQVVIAEKYRP